ncbi:MAG: lipid-A-disaccharide synthase [Planctomycetales bacterium]
MHIFFSVGEPSGDLHAAKMIEELRRRVPNAEFSGFGGPLMKAAGCVLHYRLTDLAVMGILAVIPFLGRFISLLRCAAQALDRDPPDAVVLVDFPGFNWWIARLAKRRGIKVYYYLPPQLWAWAPWRIHKMRRLVDQVLCGLRFEEEWYRQRDVDVNYVGHPFFDEVASLELDGEFLNQQREQTPTGGQIVAILPGSRDLEIANNFDVQLQMMARLQRRFPQARFLVANYREQQRQECQRRCAEREPGLPVEFHVDRTSEIIELADVCLMVSGSVSLELLARCKPTVVMYRTGLFHWVLGRLLITCPFISLPNLIADRGIMPEFVLLGDSQPKIDRMTSILEQWLSDPAQREGAAGELRRLAAQVAVPGATPRAAEAILSSLTQADLGVGTPVRAAA